MITVCGASTRSGEYPRLVLHPAVPEIQKQTVIPLGEKPCALHVELLPSTGVGPVVTGCGTGARLPMRQRSSED